MTFTVPLIFIFVILVNSEQLHIPDDILYYETLDSAQITHHVTQRNIAEHEHTRCVKFSSHKQNYVLNLRQNSDILSDTFRARFFDGKERKPQDIFIDEGTFYTGYVENDYSSDAIICIEDDVISGVIIMQDDAIYIEPLLNYAKDASKNSMIVYKDSNTRKHLNVLKTSIDGDIAKTQVVLEVDGNLTHLPGDADSKPSRKKRSTKTCKNVPQKNLCPMYLVADHSFYKHVGNSDKKSTIYHMLQAIRLADKTLKNIDFDNGNCGVGLTVQEVYVYENASNADGPQFNMPVKKTPENHEKYLRTFNHDMENLQNSGKKFCLAHLFTYRDFVDNIVGLSYVGRICNKHNVAFSNYYNSARNVRLLTTEGLLVTSHEIAHNFGSIHDNYKNNQACLPGADSDDGNFLMFNRMVSGRKSNNFKLSSCSIESISTVLFSEREKCFIGQNKTICLNGVVDKGEQCDPGLFGNEDRCCDKNCKFKQGAKCSDFNHVCCTNCLFTKKTQKESKICRFKDEMDCRDEIYCNGTSSGCPTTIIPIVDNSTSCNLGRGNCMKNGCVSLCEQLGKKACNCTITDSCSVCCYDKKAKKCQTERSLWDGTPCLVENEIGTCVKSQCQKVQKGVEDEFKKLLKDFTFSTFGRFLKANIVGTILVFSLLVWVPASCIVHHLDKKQEVEDVFTTHWAHPKNSDLVVKGGRKRLRKLFKKNFGSAKRVSGGRFHISS